MNHFKAFLFCMNKRHAQIKKSKMKLTNFPMKKRLSLALVCLICSFSLGQAQTNNPICAEGDCPTAIFSIQLDEPLKPTPLSIFSSQRTEQFKKAYLSFQQIKSSYTSNEDWTDKYEDSQLGGKSCLRHYQLEAQFAYEYVQNPDFKKFVDSKGSDANKSYVKDGFENSRKGMNLSTRMGSSCPDELKELSNKKGPSMNDLPTTYQQLGKELGYFDEKGNLLKPLDTPPPASKDEDLSKLSKRKQISALKERVQELPVGQAMKDKIGGVKNALGAARPKLGLLKGAMGLLGSRLATFLPGPFGLLSKINTVKDILGALKGLKLKLPFSGLFSKIGNLFKRGVDHGKRVEDVVNKSKKLKDKFDDLTKQGDDLKDKIDERMAAIDKLQNKLEELAKKKDELQAKLEDKPRKILDELRKQSSDLVKEAGDLADEADKESQLKDKLLEKLDEQIKAKDEVVEQLSQLEKETEDLTKTQVELEKETKDVEADVEEAKKQDKKADDLKENLENLKPEKELETEIANCEDTKVVNLDGLKKELIELIAEKSGMKDKLKQAGEKAAALEGVIQDFIKRYHIFDEKSDCISQKELEKTIEESKKEQETTATELDELDNEFNKVTQEEEQLEEKTHVVEKEIEEQIEEAEELKQEEEAIKTAYGTTDIKLNPVPVKEWAESFEVERPYWNAVFHPDDEVVEGEKGRYFEIQLKDANKNVKLLFGPCEYFFSKSDFRKKYGSTIGSFVTEALHTMKKGDQQKVKLFIQGSADIGTAVLTLSIDKTSFTCADIATNPNTVTLTVKDAANNSSTCTTEVTVVYNVAGSPTTVNSYVSGAPLSISPTGTTTYTLVSVTDAYGCTITPSSLSAVLTINVAPTLSIIQPTLVCVGWNLENVVKGESPTGGTFSYHATAADATNNVSPLSGTAVTNAGAGTYYVRYTAPTPLSIATGYLKEDINMNGNVSYNGSSNDRAIILGNIGSTTPNNIIVKHFQ